MSQTELAAIAGSIAGFLSVAAFLPQAYRILQRRSASDVSLAMYVTIILGNVLWIFYAHVHGSTELLVTNAVIALIAIFIAILRLRYGGRPDAGA